MPVGNTDGRAGSSIMCLVLQPPRSPTPSPGHRPLPELGVHHGGKAQDLWVGPLRNLGARNLTKRERERVFQLRASHLHTTAGGWEAMSHSPWGLSSSSCGGTRRASACASWPARRPTGGRGHPRTRRRRSSAGRTHFCWQSAWEHPDIKLKVRLESE